MQYCDYEFYKAEYFGDIIAESDFPRLISRAGDKLDYIVRGRIIAPDGVIKVNIPLNREYIEADEALVIKIKKAACRIAEIMQDIELYEKADRAQIGFEKTESGLTAKAIKSVSSGSESITYSDGSATKSSLVGAVLTDKKAQDKLFYDSAREYLSGTGLLYAGM